MDYLRQQIESHNLGDLLSNLELHDPQSGRRYELDIVLIAQFGIYVVDVKDWSGQIEIRPDSWLHNGRLKQNPHKANNRKAKLVKGLYTRAFSQFPPVHCESVVVLANPNVSAQGASDPATLSHCPTFDSMDRFVQNLRYQKRQRDPGSLTASQSKAFASHLQGHHAITVSASEPGRR